MTPATHTSNTTSAPPVLLGTYNPPAVRVGALVYCRFRRAWCRVTSFTDAPISWPRVQVPKQRGGCGLLVNAELQRAIRTESAAALMHWFGVRDTTAWRWRKWLKVDGWTATAGTRRLVKQTAKRGAAAIKAKEWTDEELDAKSETAKAHQAHKRFGAGRWAETGWTAVERALLGTDTDEAIAAKIGRTRSAVRSRQSKAGIPPTGAGR
jgi:hypothetical protein